MIWLVWIFLDDALLMRGGWGRGLGGCLSMGDMNLLGKEVSGRVWPDLSRDM